METGTEDYRDQIEARCDRLWEEQGDAAQRISSNRFRPSSMGIRSARPVAFTWVR